MGGLINFLQTFDAPAGGFLLDDYPADMGYSFRRLRSGATNCIRVRRSSDDTEQDIGFVSDFLDTASLLTFVGTGDGFISAWYDQSVNERNVVQSILNRQPIIVDKGVVVLDPSGRTAGYTTASGAKSLLYAQNPFPATGDITFDSFSVMDNQSTGQDNQLYGVFALTSVTDRRRVALFANDSATVKSIRLFGGNVVYASTQNGTLLYNANYQGGGGAINARINAGNLSVNSFSNAGLNIQNDSGFTLFYGRSNFNTVYTNVNPSSIGYISENIMYFSNQGANRTAIENNINAYYNIY